MRKNLTKIALVAGFVITDGGVPTGTDLNDNSVPGGAGGSATAMGGVLARISH